MYNTNSKKTEISLPQTRILFLTLSWQVTKHYCVVDDLRIRKVYFHFHIKMLINLRYLQESTRIPRNSEGILSVFLENI